MCVEHRNRPKIIKSGLNQVQVAPFELKLCEDGATPLRSIKNPIFLWENALWGAPGRNLHWSCAVHCCPLLSVERMVRELEAMVEQKNDNFCHELQSLETTQKEREAEQA